MRRIRINCEIQDNVDVPLMEEQECYFIEFFDYNNQIICIKETKNPSFKFDDELQQLNIVKVSIYQLSSKVGKGKAGIFKCQFNNH